MSDQPAYLAAKTYCAAIGAFDQDAFVTLFSPDAHFEDPAGLPPLAGHEGVAKFYSRFGRAWQSFEMQPQDIFVRGPRAAVRWTARGQSRTGRDIQFDGINVIAVNEAGQIQRLEGFWDMEGVIAQM